MFKLIFYHRAPPNPVMSATCFDLGGVEKANIAITVVKVDNLCTSIYPDFILLVFIKRPLVN